MIAKVKLRYRDDVQSDGEHHARVIIQGVERQEVIREAGLIDQPNEDRPS
jgi:hypothetical protein